MTVEEFLAWVEGQDGRWELYNGVPYRMPSEQLGHIDVKVAAYLALQRSVRKAGVPCHVVADGASVRISRDVMHVPDALVYCGPKLPRKDLEVPSPVILVEVASPSTRKFDDTVKRDGYFSLPSVHHYLWSTATSMIAAIFSQSVLSTTRAARVKPMVSCMPRRT